MASKTINPTRMELTRLKGRLRTAVRGHRLLKDKRDELMRQFFLIVRENKELRAKVEKGIEEANRAMTVASSVMSPEMLQQALLYPKQSATLDMTFQNIMSVSVPVYAFHTKSEDAASIYPYGFAQTSGELDDALGALASVFQDMLELAQAEKKTQLLASEIEKTRRRVNALEYVMIPEMEKNIKYISMKLEENDRATKVRLMKVKDMVLKDAHEFEAYTSKNRPSHARMAGAVLFVQHLKRLLLLSAPEFTENRRSENKDGSRQTGWGQRLMQDERGENQGCNGIEITHERDRLRRQANHRAEIHRIRNRRMRQRHQKHQSGGERRQMQVGKSACQCQIRHHDQSRRAKLHDGFVVCVHPGECFPVHGGDRSVQNCRADGKCNTGQCPVRQRTAVQDT